MNLLSISWTETTNTNLLCYLFFRQHLKKMVKKVLPIEYQAMYTKVQYIPTILNRGELKLNSLFGENEIFE